jgi:hypothetical protein
MCRIRHRGENILACILSAKMALVCKHITKTIRRAHPDKCPGSKRREMEKYTVSLPYLWIHYTWF